MAMEEEAKMQPPVFNQWTSLTAAQQEAMEQQKVCTPPIVIFSTPEILTRHFAIYLQVETKNANDNYISEHPELRLIIAMFLKRVHHISCIFRIGSFILYRQFHCAAPLRFLVCALVARMC